MRAAGRVVHARPRRDAGAGGGERLRQVGDRAVAAATAAAHGPLRRARRDRRAERDRRLAAGVAAAARRPRGHGVPGTDDQPQSAQEDRAAGGRGGGAAQSGAAAGDAPAHRGGAGGSRLRRCGTAPRRLPASVVGRAAAARDDRDGAGQQPRAADRRRADDRTRRDHPGPDPPAARGREAGARAGDAADQPRPRHRQEVRRSGLRDEGRGSGGSGCRARGLWRPAAPLHEAAARGRAARPARTGTGGCADADRGARHARTFPDPPRPDAAHGRACAGGRRHLVQRARGRDGRACGGERLRQIHGGLRAAAAGAGRGRGDLRGTRPAVAGAARAAQTAGAGADRVPGPVRQPVAAPERGRDRGRGPRRA